MPLPNDLLSSNCHLPPNTKLEITLRRTSNSFLNLQTEDNDAEYKFELDDVYLSMVKYDVEQDVLDEYYKHLKSGHIPRLEFCQNIIKTYPILQSSSDLSNHNLFFGNHLPENLYVFFSLQDSYNGNKHLNPYNFQTFNISKYFISSLPLTHFVELWVQGPGSRAKIQIYI